MTRKAQTPAAIAAALLTATPVFAGSIQMEAVPAPGVAPSVAADKHLILSSDQAKVNGIWNPTGYQVLLRSGDLLPLLGGSTGQTVKYGTIFDIEGDPILDGGNPRISNDNDFNSLIRGGDGNLYLISHFETRPAAVYQTRLNQDADGTLTPVATRPIDLSALQGGWVHCAGSVSPWGTHLGSEEYEPNARLWSTQPGGTDNCTNADLTKQRPSDYESAMVQYLVDGKGDNYAPTCANALAHMDPYYYGWPVEVTVPADGVAVAKKHYAMGRSANELSYAMPDGKTVYITDDGTNTMLLMFVADVTGNLDAGTLYAAKWTQLTGNAANGGRGALSWVNLGHATSAEIEAAIAGQTFDNLFQVGVLSNPDLGACPATFTSINAGHGAATHECLKATGNVSDAVLSRLETRRYAAMHGATTEFRKMEGFTFNPERRVAYLAISEINKAMESKPTSDDQGGPNHIQLINNDCGAVYELRMSGRVKDTAGNLIDSPYVAVQMSGLIAGTEVGGDPKNTCHLDGIANPDNVTYLPRYNTLIIGEDTGSGHQNDVIWSYDLRSLTLTRVMTTPYGAETTSPYWYPDIGGHAYLTGVVQHPYGESDTGEAANSPEGATLSKRGYVGYFKLPALK